MPAKKPISTAKKASKDVAASKPSKAKKLSLEASPTMNHEPTEEKKQPFITPTPSFTNTPMPNSSKEKQDKPKSKLATANNTVKDASSKPEVNPKWANFIKKQHERLLHLKDVVLDSMNAVAKDALRVKAEGSEANAFGMHQADAGSDAYDRDFALSILSQEQNSLYEIDEALKRVENGSYGICEISGKKIPQARLEALPFTRYTVECQAELEKQNRYKARQPVTSLFNLDEEAGDDDDGSSDSKD